MGEKIFAGALTYNVVETNWRSQLGDLFSTRIPQQRYLLITISATNTGTREVSIPLLTLENENGQTFQEQENGQGVDNWLGVLRTIHPTETLQGRTLFDVALTSYKLRLPDSGEPGADKYVTVQIPLSLEVDPGVQAPVPGLPGR
jgi:hypothetical protein